jgi:exodeoxyribonuclease V alpha subunit
MEERKIRLLDSQFAKFLAARSALSGKERLHFQDLICRISMGLAAGDSCLPISTLEEDLLQGSGLVGAGAEPLRIFRNRLYLQRFFEYEKSLAEKVGRLAAAATRLQRDELLLDSLFGKGAEGETDWQRVAAERALEQNLLIISGGPGTGKTTTVVKILALLQSASGQELRIAITAPTGKAAMRLQESISSSVHSLSFAASVADTIPTRASTLHRLLGVKRFSPFFRHNAANPLSYDVVVVDEASMVDLALMSKLVDALRPGSRLLLLGDKNQLASVESGTVLGDMCTVLVNNRVELQKSYRFDEGIKSFAEAITGGDSSDAWDILTRDEPVNVSTLEEDAAEYGGEIYARYMMAVVRARSLEDYQELFPLFHSFTILCALRNGPAGVSGINTRVERYLTGKGWDCFGSVWYPGRPVMVTRNDYGLDLYNGDMGLCLPDPEQPEIMKVWFEREDGNLQGILPGRISNCETVYALTIHKSQGTEVGEVLVVLPGQESALVTRELLYTAVTRATERVKVKSSRSVFSLAVAGKIKRFSGLVERLGSGCKCAEAIGKGNGLTGPDVLEDVRDF